MRGLPIDDFAAAGGFALHAPLAIHDLLSVSVYSW